MRLQGYRWWLARHRPGTGWRLRSVTWDVWWDGPHLRAQFAPRVSCALGCPKWLGLPHASKRVPAARCVCGIHAYRTERRAWDRSPRLDAFDPAGAHSLYPVFGDVAIWGKVVEHEDGYRAEHAMVRRLVVPACAQIVPQWALGCILDFDLELDLEATNTEWTPEPGMADALAHAYGADISLGPSVVCEMLGRSGGQPPAPPASQSNPVSGP